MLSVRRIVADLALVSATTVFVAEVAMSEEWVVTMLTGLCLLVL